MGKAATWIPSDGSHPSGYSVNVLFRNPTKEEKLADVAYNPYAAQIEFERTAFPGLSTAIRGGKTEYITIEGTEYLIEKVTEKWDGELSMAELVENTED
jgi:hypothetical protein